MLLILWLSKDRYVELNKSITITYGQVTNAQQQLITKADYGTTLTAQSDSIVQERGNSYYLTAHTEAKFTSSGDKITVEISKGSIYIQALEQTINIAVGDKTLPLQRSYAFKIAGIDSLFILGGELHTDEITAKSNQTITFAENKYFVTDLHRAQLKNDPAWVAMITFLTTVKQLPLILTDFDPPALSITAPLQTETDQAEVTIAGLTEVGAAVTINNTPATVEANGKFAGKVTLVSGSNELTIIASDSFNNQTTQVVKINLIAAGMQVADIIDSPNCDKGETESQLYCLLNKTRVNRQLPKLAYSKDLATIGETNSYNIVKKLTMIDIPTEVNKLSTKFTSLVSYQQVYVKDTAAFILEKIATENNLDFLGDFDTIGIGYFQHQLTIVLGKQAPAGEIAPTSFPTSYPQ